MIVKPLPPDPYRQRIVFLYGTSEDLRKWCKKHHPRTDDAITFPPAHQGKFFEFVPSSGADTTQYIALVKRKRPKNGDAIWLAHECLHCAMAVIEGKGIPINVATDEALTYYFQWLFAQCLSYLHPSRKRVAK